MSNVPDDLRYTADHEWLRTGDAGACTVGITAFAVEQLGDITLVELPAEGATVAKGDEAIAARPRHWSLPVVFGAVIGCLVTLTSVGAGAIGVTVLMILYPKPPLSRIVAADIAYAVPLTLVAGFGHASLGSVDWSMLACLLTGSLPGIWVGSHLMSKTPERVIRSMLSVLLAYAGLKLISL